MMSRTLQLIVDRARPLIVSVGLGLAATSASGDSITIDGVVSDDVKVQAIRGGVVFYLNSDSALLRADVATVEQIQFTGLRELDDARRDRARGDDDRALDSLLVGMTKTRNEAQQLWLHARLARVHAALGDFLEAAGHFGAVITIDPAPVWLDLKPTGEIKYVSFYNTAEARHYLNRAKRRAQNEALNAAVDELLAKVLPLYSEQQELNPGRNYRNDSTISGILRADIGTPAARRDREAPDPNDPKRPLVPGGQNTSPSAPLAIERHLQRADFAEALEVCERVAANPGRRDVAQFLSQYGRALAGAGRKKDATIQLMRCAILFPGSPHAATSLIETAVIYHEVYGDPETSRRLLNRALELATELDEPRLAKRASDLLNQ